VEDTISDGFEYRYFGIRDAAGDIVITQPFFLLDQDVVAGLPARLLRVVAAIRRFFPHFLKVRTLMVGCVAGEGHLDGPSTLQQLNATTLAADIVPQARKLRARLIVLKEFPARYRQALSGFLQQGFVRVPSMPMTALSLDYESFDDYLMKALSRGARRKFRKKLRDAEKAVPLALAIMNDASSIVEELYPLYVSVYERSKLHFEKLTKEFFLKIGARIPEKVLFFIWRQEGRVVAFTLCMIEGDSFFAEYIGLDYRVALDLHLYHYAVRDMVSWAIAHGYKWFRSSALNYDPKLHLGHKLDPVDLYVRHTSPLMNASLRLVLPWIEPTRYDPILRKFENYSELRA
jgi:predicted N-acyltransferase